MSHTHRAIADGFYDGVLVSKDATFTPYEGFEAPWAVEVAERANTSTNAGEQETLSEAIKPVLPELSDAAAPLPAFHPAVSVPTNDKVEDAKASAAVGDPVKQPVVASADSRSTSDPKKAKPPVKRKDPDVPSEAEVEAAKEASKAEVEQADKVDDGADLT